MQTFDEPTRSASAEIDETEQRRRAVEDIVTDETMPVADRQARLEALAADWQVPGEPALEDVASDPLRVQIANALALLAQGGHRNAP